MVSATVIAFLCAIAEGQLQGWPGQYPPEAPAGQPPANQAPPTQPVPATQPVAAFPNAWPAPLPPMSMTMPANAPPTVGVPLGSNMQQGGAHTPLGGGLAGLSPMQPGVPSLWSS